MDQYLVSIRAAKNNLVGADTIAVKFGGGGRKGAAGVDRLLETEIDPLWADLPNCTFILRSPSYGRKSYERKYISKQRI